ncbi:MAG: protein-disulfide reductase DsbD domain-containing protein [Flavisolibacter sp.]
MMKFGWLTAFILLSMEALAQDDNPVDWRFTSKKINATTYEVQLSASLDEDWHIYSQSTPKGGPAATSISFAKNPLVGLNGSVKEVGKLEQHFEPLFGVQVKQYSGKVDFVQTVTVKAGVKTALKGNVEFMTCNENECLPPRKVNFSVELK